MSKNREAKRDAKEFARAAMYYGEGAGIRRKMINQTVDAKIQKSAAYSAAFNRALAEEDMAKHAAAARRERRSRDAGRAVYKSASAIQRGDYSNVHTGLLVFAAGAYFAHQKGYDKKAMDFVKQKVGEVKQKVKGDKVFNIYHGRSS